MLYLLLDGYNLAFRAHFGMADLTRADGFPTGALHGWVRTLWYLQDTFRPDRMIVFFDLGEDTHRAALLADYKAQRSPTPEPLVQQLPLLRKITPWLGMATVEEANVEADDLLGAAARHLAAEGHTVKIVSADKDLGQVVGGPITQLVPPPTANPKLGWRELDAAGVAEKFGVEPKQIPDYLALIGDTSDNIPGINGVGPVTAAKWLRQYGNLEGIFNYCGQLNPARLQQVVHDSRELLRRNLLLTTLRTLPPRELPAPPPVARAELFALLAEMEMNSTLKAAKTRYGEG